MVIFGLGEVSGTNPDVGRLRKFDAWYQETGSLAIYS